MDEATVACTACGDPVPVDETECPHCGKSFITRQQAKVMIFLVYPIVLPVPAGLLAAAVPPAWYGDGSWLLGFGLLTALFYGTAAGWTWLLYRRCQRRIDRAVAAAEERSPPGEHFGR